MTGGSVPQEAVDQLRATISGETLTPVDAAYEEVRQVHNGMIDKRPAVIVRCQNTAGIADAVKFAREHDLEISVRGGGHNVAGRTVTGSGLMIDTQTMKGVHVDPASRRVRAQAGLSWNEYNRATAAYGLATTGGVVSATGIAGLTLGGGLGWLMGAGRVRALLGSAATGQAYVRPRERLPPQPERHAGIAASPSRPSPTPTSPPTSRTHCSPALRATAVEPFPSCW
jgi:FAD binding domain